MSRDILIELIDPAPDQPRTHFDIAGLEELAQSIKVNGLAVPILVRPIGDRFVIVHGERRWRAFKMLNRQTIPAEVRDIDPAQAAMLALIENVQRADLSPIEEARAYRHYLKGGITQAELGKKIGKSQSYIAGKMRYLKLPEPIQNILAKGEITEGHAKQLLRINDDYPLQKTIVRLIFLTDASVAETKEAIDLDSELQEIGDRVMKLVGNLYQMGMAVNAVKRLSTPEVFDQWVKAELVAKAGYKDMFIMRVVGLCNELESDNPIDYWNPPKKLEEWRREPEIYQKILDWALCAWQIKQR